MAQAVWIYPCVKFCAGTLVIDSRGHESLALNYILNCKLAWIDSPCQMKLSNFVCYNKAGMLRNGKLVKKVLP